MRRFKIKVVPVSNPNAEWRVIDCGYNEYVPKAGFKEDADRLSKYCPEDHFIAALWSIAD